MWQEVKEGQSDKGVRQKKVKDTEGEGTHESWTGMRAVDILCGYTCRLLPALQNRAGQDNTWGYVVQCFCLVLSTVFCFCSNKQETQTRKLFFDLTCGFGSAFGADMHVLIHQVC